MYLVVDVGQVLLGMAPVHQAAGRNDVVRLKTLLNEEPELIEAWDDDWPMGKPLHKACAAGSAEAVRLLLNRGADPCTKQRGWNPLMLACHGKSRGGSDHIAVIRLLLEDDRVPVNVQNGFRRTALSHACLQGHIDRARVLLLEGGADHSVVLSEYARCQFRPPGRSGADSLRLLRVRAWR